MTSVDQTRLRDRIRLILCGEKAFVTGMFIEPGYRNIGVRVTVRTN